MAIVDEYVKMAEAAGADNAHVAVLMHYRSALEAAGYSSNAAPVLLAAVQYAQGLKKPIDRTAVAVWGTESLARLKPASDLEKTISMEIEKLQASGGSNSPVS